MAPVVLILGAGPGIGAHCANSFHAAGYKVALAARRMSDKLVEEGRLELHADLADPTSVPDIFAKVTKEFGAPDVVIYNAYSRSIFARDDPLSFPLQTYRDDMDVTVTSALAAAQEAVRGWKERDSSTTSEKRQTTFIYTGNKLNVMAWPHVMIFGMGKTAITKMIWDSSVGYRSRGYKFYYADERTADGNAVALDIDGAAAAETYLKLAEDQQQQPWLYTFVKGKGYRDFRATDKAWDVNIHGEA